MAPFEAAGQTQRRISVAWLGAPALLALAYSIGAAPPPLPAQAARDSDDQRRERMVSEQIERRGVRDPRVLAALRETPRHRFVPPQVAGQAYEDYPLPIGHGQTISQPYIVAYMSELLRVGPGDRVLEIGAGSGYQAAVLSRLAKEVFTIERIEALANESRDRLAALGYANVHVRYGDGYLGWPEQAPFDRILLTAAPETLPEALIEQLAPGGRLVAPVGGHADAQSLIIVEKDRRGRVQRRQDLPVRFVPMLPEIEKAP